MLKKEEKERISLEEMAQDPWITCRGQEPCDWANDVEYVEFADPTEKQYN